MLVNADDCLNCSFAWCSVSFLVVAARLDPANHDNMASRAGTMLCPIIHFKSFFICRSYSQMSLGVQVAEHVASSTG